MFLQPQNCAATNDLNCTEWKETVVTFKMFKMKQYNAYTLHASLQIAWTRLHGFSGFMVWDLDLDDFINNPEWCNQGRFPLINGMKAEWNNPTVDPCDVICPVKTPNDVPDMGCDSKALSNH